VSDVFGSFEGKRGGYTPPIYGVDYFRLAHPTPNEPYSSRVAVLA
jgi:hypothetical protein